MSGNHLPIEITPAEVKKLLDAGHPLKLIDVREPIEHKVARIDGSELLPMRSVPSELSRLEAEGEEKTLIVFCHHGVRSFQVASWLREKGVARCQSMAGGIDRWSCEVDPTVPRYY
jgi:rhodanese-related sulfurtransferase